MTESGMSESESYKEKRGLRRFTMVVQLTYFNFNANKVGKAKIKDMSIKGLGLLADEALEPNVPLDIWIDLPDTGEQVHAVGEVLWVKRIEGDQYRIGVTLKYSGLDPLPAIIRRMQSNLY
jgi:hypothetical protein